MIVSQTGLAERFAAAATYPQFLSDASTSRDLWLAVDSHLTVPEDLIRRAIAAGQVRRAIVLAEDWCGDAVNVVPHVARFFEEVPGFDLRIFPRDANPDLMDTHLTGGSRSIPVVILYDAWFREVGWWGPRPAALQAWVRAEGVAMDREARYREIRKWYARDKGRTTLEEIVGLMETAG